MCLLTATDQPSDVDAPSLREKADAAWFVLTNALRARHLLLIDLDEGATSAEFGRSLPDERLKAANRAAFEADYVYQQAAHALMIGETHVGTVTSLSLALAMQIRLGRNDKAAARPVPAAHPQASASVGGL